MCIEFHVGKLLFKFNMMVHPSAMVEWTRVKIRYKQDEVMNGETEGFKAIKLKKIFSKFVLIASIFEYEDWH